MKKSSGSLANVSSGKVLRGIILFSLLTTTHSYLRASKWKGSSAIQRLESTLKWRREFGLYDLVNAKHVEQEVRTATYFSFVDS